MMYSTDEDNQPFSYARVIGVFHARVRYTGIGATNATREPRTLYFLWVRWFEVDHSFPHGFLHRRLPRVKFLNSHDSDTLPFGFVDPANVLRASYIMPAFDHGETQEYLSSSKLARREGDNDEDFTYYYICM